MKFLSNYIDEATTKLLNDNGAFFAFSDKQFDEAKQPNVKYSHLFGGLICPEQNTKTVLDGLKNITQEGIKQDIKENGINNIIIRELANHEAYYTGDITDTANYLAAYDITAEQIIVVYNQEKQNHAND